MNNIDPKKLFNNCLRQSSQVVSLVRPGDLHNRTPDKDWNVQQLLQHMYYELSWIKEVMSGKTIEEVGDKYDHLVIDESLLKNWDKEALRALQTVNKADINSMVHLSYGEHKAEQYIQQISGELVIHAWDLSVGINKPLLIDRQIVVQLYDLAKPKSKMMSASGLFSPVLPTTKDDDLQTKLLALYGRKTPN